MSGRRLRSRTPRSRPRSRRGSRSLEDLPDKLLLRVLQELPQSDLLQVARVSSRLHGLSLDSSLWRDLGTLGPEVATEHACALLRNAPSLTALRLHGRHDADTLLIEASRYCRHLEELELWRCRGSRGFRQVAYVPLVKLAQACRRLRSVQFKETDFMCSRVFKVWADSRGPDDPALHIGVNCLSRRQANYLTGVLGGPAELHTHAMQATPLVLRVHGHKLSLQHAVEAVQADVAVTDSAGPSGVVSTPASWLYQHAHMADVGHQDDDMLTVFERARAASRIGVRADRWSGDSDESLCLGVVDDNMDVVAGHSSGAAEYKSLFGVGCASEPLVNSWFRSGYMPGCTPGGSTANLDPAKQVRPCSVLLPMVTADGADDEVVEVTAEVEAASAAALRPCLPLPACFVRLAASLKEPQQDQSESDEQGDPSPRTCKAAPVQQAHGLHAVHGDVDSSEVHHKQQQQKQQQRQQQRQQSFSDV